MAVQPVLLQGGSQAPAKSSEGDGPNALAAFNTKFRQAGEEKDAKEREAKAARKVSGKAALKKMLTERNERVATRKAGNREAEKAAEKDMLSALSGESWCRVVSLVDANSAAHHGDDHKGAGEKKAKAGGAAHAGGSAEAIKAGGGVGDTLRLKDVRSVDGAKGPLPFFFNAPPSLSPPPSCPLRLGHPCPSLPLHPLYRSRLQPHNSLPQILISLKAKPL